MYEYGIRFLLWLQGHRTDTVTAFFERATVLGEDKIYFFVLAFIYWCVNTDLGWGIGFALNMANIIGTFLKGTVRQLRPYYYCDKLEPVASALTGATGYSFPSGHTIQACTVYGGVCLDKKVPLTVKTFLWFLAVVIGFSRLYLGVHSIFDVLAATIISVIVLMILMKNDINAYFMRRAVIATIIATVIIFILPYDKVNELADENMYRTHMDMFKKFMMMISFYGMWLWNSRIQFENNKKMSKRIIELILGLLVLYAFMNYGKELVEKFFLLFLSKQNGRIVARGFNNALIISFIYGIYPWLICKFRKNERT